MKLSRRQRLDELSKRVDNVTNVLYEEGKSAGECYKLEVVASLLLHLLKVMSSIQQLLLIVAFALSALFALLACRLG